MALIHEITELEVQKAGHEEELQDVENKIIYETAKLNFCEKKQIIEELDISASNIAMAYNIAIINAKNYYRSTTMNKKAEEMEETKEKILKIKGELKEQKEFISKTINLVNGTLEFWKNRRNTLNLLIEDIDKKIKELQDSILYNSNNNTNSSNTTSGNKTTTRGTNYNS